MRFTRRPTLGRGKPVRDTAGGEERGRDRAGTDKGARSRFERVMFSFMGPPQLGDVNAPSTFQPDPAAALCPKCRQPWDEHEIVRTTSRTYATCPRAQT